MTGPETDGGTSVKNGRWLAAGLLLVAMLMLVACASETPPPDLAGTKWTALTFTVGGSPQTVLADFPITAEFSADGTMSGSAGVNQYSTGYKQDGSNLTVDQAIVTTKMAGPQEAMDQEADYLVTLKTVQSFLIDEKNGGQLVLMGPAENTIARYNPAK